MGTSGRCCFDVDDDDDDDDDDTDDRIVIGCECAVPFHSEWVIGWAFIKVGSQRE